MTAFTVLCAPLHAPSAKRHPRTLCRELRRVDADTAGLTEAYAVRRPLDRIRGHRVVVEAGGQDDRRGQYDNPIVVRDQLRSLGSGQLFAAAASTPERIAPERWTTYSVVDHPAFGPVCHVNIHPHAAIEDKHGRLRVDTDRGREAQRQFVRLDAFLDLVDAMGWATVVTGDVNFHDGSDDAWSPYRILRNHDLQVFSRGIVAVAWSPQLELDVEVHHAPSSITDHPWLVGTARRAREGAHHR